MRAEQNFRQRKATFDKYTPLQQVRRLNAEHHREHIRLLYKLRKTSELLQRRQRGEYNEVERDLLAATVKVISAFLKLDERVRNLRLSIEKLDRLQKGK